MIEIGQRAPEFRGEGSTIKSVVEGLKYNKIFAAQGVTTSLDLTVANKIEYIEVMPFKRWRVIGLGLLWLTQSTANEDPIVEFGRMNNNDAYGKMTSAITGGEKFSYSDHQKYDPLNILLPEEINETSATLVTTWTEGVEFGVWCNERKSLRALEAAAAGMSSGSVKPYMIIEVDTGGKW